MNLRDNYTDFLESAIDSLYYSLVVDKDGKIVRMSQNYLNILGVEGKHVYGKRVDKIINNTKMLEIIESKEDDVGSLFELANGEKVICNRLCMYRDGEFKGVVSSAIFANFKELDQLNKKLENLEKQNIQYLETIKETKKQIQEVHPVIGETEEIKNIKKIINEVADSNLTVLLTGETGTGKEVFANSLEYKSNRRNESYIKVNCAAIPKDLIESELFGYEKGSFTGALDSGKMGKFELADKGTILLDEIGELPLNLQSKLLRVLEEEVVDRIGGKEPIPIDVRVICCTNKNLKKLVEENKFREDLFYRINVVELEIPPLRDRIKDIDLLVEFFIGKINKIHGLYVEGIDQRVLDIFYRYRWDGNVRELEHILERAMVIKKSGKLEIEDFKFFISRISLDKKPAKKGDELAKSLEEVEREKIKKALIKTENNKTAAAKILGISRGTLYSRINKYKLDIFKNT